MRYDPRPYAAEFWEDGRLLETHYSTLAGAMKWVRIAQRHYLGLTLRIVRRIDHQAIWIGQTA